MPTWTKPVTLTANTNENVNDLNSILDDIYSRANGGIDETNVPNLAAAFTTYQRLGAVAGWAELAGAVTGTFLMQRGFTNAGSVIAGAGASTHNFVHVFDPAPYVANTRTTKLNLRAWAIPNGTAPAVNYTVGLYPVATYGGAAAGGTPFVATIGAVVAGSTATITAPALNALSGPVSSGDFNFPAAGGYVLGVVPSAATSANEVIHIGAHLDVRRF